MLAMSKALFILPLLAAFLWAACAGASPDPPPLPPTLQELRRPFKADLPELRKLGIIRVLTVYSQSYFFIHQGQPYGLDYALLEEYQRILNRHHPKGAPPMGGGVHTRAHGAPGAAAGGGIRRHGCSRAGPSPRSAAATSALPGPISPGWTRWWSPTSR